MSNRTTAGRWCCSGWTAVVAAMALCAGAALAQSPDNKPQSGRTVGEKSPTTKPAAEPSRSGDDVEALKRLILEKMKRGEKPPTTQASQQPTKLVPQRTARSRPDAGQPEKPVPSSSPVFVQPVARDGQGQPVGQTAPATQPGKGPGCGPRGETQPDLRPPPPDQPQPLWVCDRETVEIEPVWRGEQATFVFDVRNEGQGLLNIQLRGG